MKFSIETVTQPLVTIGDETVLMTWEELNHLILAARRAVGGHLAARDSGPLEVGDRTPLDDCEEGW